MKSYAIGTDIGGSHISCALINLQEKSLLKDSITKQQVNNQATAIEILEKWRIALQKTLSLISKNDLVGVGFAMPGPFDYAKGIALFTKEVAKYEKLHGIDVASGLSKRLDLSPGQFRFMNDASAFAVGEAWMGKARKVTRSLSITLGTGFGSAFVDKGLLVVDREDVPRLGCVWHLPYRKGIADDYFSTRWFIRRYFEMTGLHVHGVRDIAMKAVTEKVAKDIFVEFGSNLGEFLGHWLKKFRAEMLVIGGNVSGAYHLFGGAFDSSLKNQDIQILIEISELMEESAIAGSAHMFDNTFWLKVQPLLSKM
jgi:glucokinase